MKNNLIVRPSGHGHYKVITEHYNKEISCITNDMSSIDDLKSEEGEKDGRVLKRLRGYNNLRNECIRKNKQKA